MDRRPLGQQVAGAWALDCLVCTQTLCQMFTTSGHGWPWEGQSPSEKASEWHKIKTILGTDISRNPSRLVGLDVGGHLTNTTSPRIPRT